MNCLEFERLLDQGEPERLPDAARAHARECARCQRSLARARSLERALDQHFSSALASGEQVPGAFVDAVMERVHRGEARGVRWLLLPDALPWWVRAAAEPPVAFASGVAALILWRGDAVLSAARSGLHVHALATRIVEWFGAVGLDAGGSALARAFVPGPGAHWSVIAAMAIGVAPALALAGYSLWRLGERLADPTGALVAIR